MIKKKAIAWFTPSRIVFYVLSIVVFYLGVRYVGKLNNIETLLLEMNPAWLFLAVVSQITTYLFNAMILYFLLDRNIGTANFFTFFKMSIVIIFINQTLPSGGLSGNGYLFNQFVKRKAHASTAFRVLILESLSYYIATITLLLLLYVGYLQSNTSINSVITYTVLGGTIYFLFLGVLLLVLSNSHTVSFILKKFGHINWIKRYVHKLDRSLLKGKYSIGPKDLLSKRKNTIFAILLQMGIISCDVITAFAIMKGFHVQLPFPSIAFAFLLTMVIGALPLSPGSLIAYEGAMTYFLTVFGSPVHAALIVTLVFRFLTFWLPMPVGLLFYRNLQKKILLVIQ